MPTNPFEAGAPVASVHSFAHADKMIEDALADVHPQAHPEHARASHTEEVRIPESRRQQVPHYCSEGLDQQHDGAVQASIVAIRTAIFNFVAVRHRRIRPRADCEGLCVSVSLCGLCR